MSVAYVTQCLGALKYGALAIIIIIIIIMMILFVLKVQQ